MKRFISFFIAMVMLCSVFSLPSSAMGGSKGSATKITVGKTYESHLSVKETEWYSIVPDETQYYRFHIRNQSIEWRSGIGLFDFFGNLFNSYIDVLVYDARDDKLGKMSVRCGYEGQLALKLEKGKTYYITVQADYAEGNYWLSTTKLNDVGGDTWSQAIDTLSNGQLISAVDASSDKDWFCFNAEPERAYYTFKLENIGGESHINFTLYQYVAGAGEFPMREVRSISVSRGNTGSFDLQLEEGNKYYYCISGSKAGYVLDVSMRLDAAGGSLSESYKVNVGEAYITSFDGTNDVDYYEFRTGNSPAYYHFDVENLTGSYYNVWVYDSMGNVVTSSSGSRKVNLDYKPATGSTYYLALKGTDANYKFSVTEKKDIYADEMKDASAISFGKEYKTSFDGTNDRDYIKFTTGSSAAYYHLEVKNLSDSWLNVWLMDADGNDVVSNSGYSTSNNAKLDPNKTYFVLFKGSDSNYNFKITEKKDSYADEMDKATKISLNKEYSSSFDGTNDRDYIKFTTGSSAAYYHLEVKNLSDSWLNVWLMDADGNDVVSNSGYSTSNNAKLDPNKTYFVLFKGSDSNYNFKITEKKDSYADEMDKATKISLNKEYSSSFDGTNDKDYVKFTTGSSAAYYHLEVKNLSNSWLNVWLMDADGNDVVSNSGYSTSNNAKLDPNKTYFVLFKGSNSNYKFKLTQKVDAESDEKEGGKTVKLNSLKDGSLQASSDVDWFKVSVSSEGNYRLRVVNDSSDSISITLYNSRESSECSLSTYNETSRVVYLKGGTYYVRVSGYGTGIYSFVLATCGDGHKETYTYPSKSTMSKDGQKRATCSKCGTFIGTSPVAKIESATLSKTAYTYDGKVKAPTVTVKDCEGKKLKNGTDYKITYESGRKLPGKYTVRIDFMGKYSGTKRLYFTIAPKVTSKVKASQTTSTITLKWNKVTGATGYRVYQYNTKTKKYESIKTLTGTSLKVSKLKAGTSYKFKIKAYKKDDGTIWGSATSAITVATKPVTPKITKLTTTKGKAVFTWSNVSGESGYQVYYSTKKDGDFKKVATYKANVVKGSKSKLKSGKKYYFKVRAYKKTASGTVYSAWSTAKSVKIK